MLELFTEAIRPINLAFTILLGFVVVYWFLVSLGMLGLDVDPDLELDGEMDAGWLASVLGFINIGEVPVTIVLSFMTLFAWMLSMFANFYLTGGSLMLGLVALLPILLVSALATRYCTLPFKPLMRALNKGVDEDQPMIGRTCEIITTEANASFGQARVDTKGAPLLINVRISEGTPLSRGTTGLVVREDSAKGIYYVVPISSANLE